MTKPEFDSGVNSVDDSDLEHSLSPVRLARREAIVDAAEALFLKAGYRGATMEALAQEAGLSKATVYGYFRDKEAAFGAVVKRFFARFAASIDQELSSDADVETRIVRAVLTKHRVLHEYLGGSPHMQELMGARHEIADMVSVMDGEIIARFQNVLEEAGFDKVAAEDTARVLFRAAAGISEHVGTADEYEADVRVLVPALLGRRQR